MKRLPFFLLPFAFGVTYLGAACGDTDIVPQDDASTPVDDSGTADTGIKKDGSTDGSTPDGSRPDGSAPDGGPVARDLCKQTKTGTKGVVLKGTVLLPETVADAGEVFYDGATIVCAGADCSTAPGYAAASVVTCTDVVISPGLINPHDHIAFANNPPKTHGTERYEHRHDWRKGVRGHRAISTRGSAPANVVRHAELRFIMSGATATAGAGGVAGLLRNLDNGAAQLEGLEGQAADSDTFPLGDSNLTTFPTTCAGWTGTRTTAASIASLDGYLPHISEGIDDSAHAEFTCQSQDGDTHDLIQKQTAVIHGIAVTPADVAKYRTDMTALVWSPRSNVDLYGDTASVAMYDRMGVQIALGTDWVASGSMNMARELRCADELNQKYFNKHFSDKALWKMVTQNAAFATGFQKVTGMLKAGYAADIALFDAKTSKSYRAVIDAGVEDTVLVLRGGKALYGDTNVLKLPAIDGATCEDLDVCGVAKKACVAKDTNNAATLAAIRTAGETDAAGGKYPLFFCKNQKPTDEPSCVPYRSTYTAGITAADSDGDGVPNATDNCPTTFNPPRPMTGPNQADADNDGIGDACDKCPLEAGEACTPPSADDIDGDGVLNGVDNCPEIPNPAQDDCAKLVTVQELRDPSNPNHPKAGEEVRLENLYVTAIRTDSDKGFFVQINSTDPFSGFFVSTGSATPTVAVGNQVKIAGKYAERFNVTTITNPRITVVAATTTLPFNPYVIASAVYADNAQGEPYEGMLCQIDSSTVSLMNADGAQDFDEFQIDGVLRVDDACYAALDNTYAVGTTFTKIVGICGYSFNNPKVMPRGAADIVTP
jgi:cytosine/adenosine deaminase-related metal-dependent hydrolase